LYQLVNYKKAWDEDRIIVRTRLTEASEPCVKAVEVGLKDGTAVHFRLTYT